MSPAATRERLVRVSRERARRGGDVHSGGRSEGEGRGRRVMLDERISAIWDQLLETGTSECPVCSSEIAAGRPCSSCGSELS